VRSEKGETALHVALKHRQEEAALAFIKALENFEARHIRLQQASDQRLRRDVSEEALCPLYSRIGHSKERRNRAGWGEPLEASLMELALRERDLATDLRVLCGDLDGQVKMVVMKDERRIVCFLLSSTFTDTEWERNLIIADVVPYLQVRPRLHARSIISSEQFASSSGVNEMEALVNGIKPPA
jgi:hypothetical protein